MARPLLLTSGHTSAQYSVQATTRSSLPMAARTTVALGCRQTTRCGVESAVTDVMVQAETTWGQPPSAVPPSEARQRCYWERAGTIVCECVINFAGSFAHHPCTSTCLLFAGSQGLQKRRNNASSPKYASCRGKFLACWKRSSE